MEFSKHIIKKIELIAGKLPKKVKTILKNKKIVEVDWNYFIDSDGKKYKIGWIITRLYWENQDLIDAIIWILKFEVWKVYEDSEVYEVYQWDAVSCMQYDDTIEESWEELKNSVRNSNLYILYIKNEYNYIWRVIIDEKNNKRWAIYTNWDKQVFKLLENLVLDFYEDSEYDLSIKKNEYIDKKIEEEIYNLEMWRECNEDIIQRYIDGMWIKGIKKYRWDGFIINLYKNNLINEEDLKELWLYDITNGVYWDEELYLMDENSEIIEWKEVIWLEEEINWYWYVEFNRIKKFMKAYKSDITTLVLEQLKEYI